MKSFFKFIGFLIGWYVIYRIVSAFSNWVMDKLSGVVDPTKFVGQLIIVVIACTIIFNGLYFPIMIVGKMMLDKTVYCIISMVLIGILCLVSFFAFSGSWVFVVVNIVHTAANLFPLFLVTLAVKGEADEAKKKADEEYKENLKAEIIQEMKENGNL